jgi:hypothetical protein
MAPWNDDVERTCLEYEDAVGDARVLVRSHSHPLHNMDSVSASGTFHSKGAPTEIVCISRAGTTGYGR